MSDYALHMHDAEIEMRNGQLRRDLNGPAIQFFRGLKPAGVLMHEAEIDVGHGPAWRERDHLLIERRRAREIIRVLRGDRLSQKRVGVEQRHGAEARAVRAEAASVRST